MWGYPMYPQQSPGDVIVGKILEEWFEDQKKSKKEKKDDDKKKGINWEQVFVNWFVLVASAPVVVGFWYTIGWAWSQIFH